MIDLNFKGLSTEATIAKVLILVGLLLKIVGVIVIFGGLVPVTNVSMTLGIAPFTWVLAGALTAFGLLAIAGIIVLWKGLGKFKQKDYSGAAIFALIAAFLPPIGAPELVGAILLLIGPELKGSLIAKKK